MQIIWTSWSVHISNVIPIPYLSCLHAYIFSLSWLSLSDVDKENMLDRVQSQVLHADNMNFVKCSH